MTNSGPGEHPKIELDLTDERSDHIPSSRRSRSVVEIPMPSAPKIEPVLGETDIGSDEAEYTVGVFFLVSAIPGLISLFVGHGAGGILSIAIPIYLGVGLLRGDDFAHQWALAACPGIPTRNPGRDWCNCQERRATRLGCQEGTF
jgi:hypothetical protein